MTLRCCYWHSSRSNKKKTKTFRMFPTKIVRIFMISILSMILITARSTTKRARTSTTRCNNSYSDSKSFSSITCSSCHTTTANDLYLGSGGGRIVAAAYSVTVIRRQPTKIMIPSNFYYHNDDEMLHRKKVTVLYESKSSSASTSKKLSTARKTKATTTATTTAKSRQSKGDNKSHEDKEDGNNTNEKGNVMKRMTKKRKQSSIISKRMQPKKATKTVRKITSKRTSEKNKYETEWNRMIRMFQEFQNNYGNINNDETVNPAILLLSSSSNNNNELNRLYPGLYQWAISIRRNYRYQALPYIQQQQNCDDNDVSTTLLAKEQQLQQPEEGKKRRPRLSDSKLQQLIDYNFPWDIQDLIWKRRYHELQQFYNRYGHCNVPIRMDDDEEEEVSTYDMYDTNNNYKTTRRKSNSTISKNSKNYSYNSALGIWVQNQRSEYRKYRLEQLTLSNTITTTTASNSNRIDNSNSTIVLPSKINKSRRLSFERILLLEKLNFYNDYRSHDVSWDGRYQQLIEFYRKYNHSNVPVTTTISTNKITNHNNTYTYTELGVWCNNQRTAYRLYRLGEKSGMTMERVSKLEKLNFQWYYRKNLWYSRLYRLKNYYDTFGHVAIPTNDMHNRDLRVWLIIQRYHYNNLQNTNNATDATTTATAAKNHRNPLTQGRIDAIEQTIPNFTWKAREGKNGPSSKDWEKLFDAMRDKGIQPGMAPKQHWFQGTNPFSMNVKERYTEQDLLELWYQDESDDDDDDNDTNSNDVANISNGKRIKNVISFDIDSNTKSNKIFNYYIDEASNTTFGSPLSTKRQQRSGWNLDVKSRKIMDGENNNNNRTNIGTFAKPPLRPNHVEMTKAWRQKSRRKQKQDEGWDDEYEIESIASSSSPSILDDSNVLQSSQRPPLAIASLLTGSAEQIVRERRTYSDLMKDEDDDEHDPDPLLFKDKTIK